MSQADGERERETERCSQGNSQQTDRRIWVPGNALHSSAHLDRLHTTRRTDLPESDRAIITSCEQGGERLQSRPHSMNSSKGCIFYLNITFKLGFQEVLWPQHRKLKEKIKMNMEFKKKKKNPKQVVFRKNFKDRVVEIGKHYHGYSVAVQSVFTKHRLLNQILISWY